MKRTDHHNQAASILRKISYATLATVSRTGEPWNSPVFAICDDQLCIYWISDKESKHSRNVRHNGKVFIVIYDSTVPEGQGQGVYIKAQATQLKSSEEIQKVRRMKKGKSNGDPASFMGNSARRIYKAVPNGVWVNDVEIRGGAFIRDYRVKLSPYRIKEILSKWGNS